MIYSILILLLTISIAVSLIKGRQLKSLLKGKKNIEEFARETERKITEHLYLRLDELREQEENNIEDEKIRMREELRQLKKSAELEIKEENSILRAELELKRKQLDEDLANHRNLFKDKIHEMENLTAEKSKQLEEDFREKVRKIEEDKLLIQKTLADLALKRKCTLEALKEEEKNRNELDFKKIVFSESDTEDISQLKKVEKLINNKDVLRKLIYKTYVEFPMNEMFNRIGAKTKPGIYKIENLIDGRIYIGQSVNVRNRLRDHIKSALGISTIANQAVHSAMSEEGLENFFFQIMTNCGREDLNEMEKYWIDYYKSGEWGYNKTKGGS